MSKDRSSDIPLPEISLRQRAEAFLRTSRQDLQTMPLENVQRLVHELQVYQIELELQNEELRRTQHELAVSRDRYSNLYEFAPVGYLTLDEAGIIVEANLTVTKVLGVERTRLLQRRLSRFVAPQDLPLFERARQEIRINGLTQTCELRFKSKAVQWFEVRLESCATSSSYTENGRCRMVLIDITERKQLDEQLRHSEERYRQLAHEREQQLIISDRLVSFGELAASLAHEFNNPLGIVLGFAQDLLSETSPAHPYYRRLQIIEAETRRCGQLMKDLLELARPSAPQFLQTDLAALIRRSLDLVAGQLRRNKIQTVLNLPSDLPLIQIDPQRVEQVLLNLYFNAIEAMPDGGTLTVRVACRSCVPPGESSRNDLRRHREVVITVVDTGIGIAPDNLPRIFRSFFTTKREKGMGLGLSICQSIIQAHGGRITVDSTLAQGTTFTIYLPVKGENHS